MGYVGILKGNFPQRKNVNEPTNEPEQRRGRSGRKLSPLSSCPRHIPYERYSPTHSMKLRSGIRKSPRNPQGLNTKGSNSKPQQFIDHCQAVIDVTSNPSPQGESDRLWADTFKQRMGEIYKDIHAASAPGLKNVSPKIEAKQVLESKLRGPIPWINSRLWLALAARNQVIG